MFYDNETGYEYEQQLYFQEVKDIKNLSDCLNNIEVELKFAKFLHTEFLFQKGIIIFDDDTLKLFMKNHNNEILFETNQCIYCKVLGPEIFVCGELFFLKFVTTKEILNSAEFEMITEV